MAVVSSFASGNICSETSIKSDFLDLFNTKGFLSLVRLACEMTWFFRNFVLEPSI
ncbi:hypothetical protein [Acinetobacter bouvetii]|uniref:hypothetical protein n=1 Tax=Acinetobacter bouvetii TaxID=202951 RepID=UPI00157C3A15|nr:hypothetical protein [Acinetobacter bouvetii]